MPQNTKAMVLSTEADSDFFDIVVGLLQRGRLSS